MYSYYVKSRLVGGSHQLLNKKEVYLCYIDIRQKEVIKLNIHTTQYSPNYTADNSSDLYLSRQCFRSIHPLPMHAQGEISESKKDTKFT